MAMAKGGMSKLRCMIRRWHSSSRISRAPSAGDDDVIAHGGGGASFDGTDEVPKGLHLVYVGKSQRRYLIAEELVGHPLFQNLVDRSGGSGGDAAGTVVGCEVVLFEHLLWMLENTDPKLESLDELVEYYTCCSAPAGRDGGAPESPRKITSGNLCFVRGRIVRKRQMPGPM